MDSLVAGTEQTDGQSSGSNFQQSNWQKVQFNTDSLKHGTDIYTENDGID